MERYSGFRPTQFDHNIDIDRADWLVCPVTHNRDSGALDESNWQAQIKALSEADGDESDTENWEIHRFGHWAVDGLKSRLSGRIPQRIARPTISKPR